MNLRVSHGESPPLDVAVDAIAEPGCAPNPEVEMEIPRIVAEETTRKVERVLRSRAM
jgi:hypothetical protein